MINFIVYPPYSMARQQLQFGRLVQEKRSSIANELELRLSYTNHQNENSTFCVLNAIGQQCQLCNHESHDKNIKIIHTKPQQNTTSANYLHNS